MEMIDKILAEYVKRDYYTPNIKAEVMLDTILTPVIDKVLTVIGEKATTLGIKGEMKLLAKEFPILNKSILEESEDSKKKTAYYNCNADYLMCDDASIYFVELKTTYNSFGRKQYDNYIKHCINGNTEKTFGNTAGKNFIELLSHIYFGKEESDNWTAQKEKGLEMLFHKIVTKKYDKNCCYVDKAINYLKESGGTSSKKYLLTAGQMLDNMKDCKWWNFKQSRLLYLMPEPSQKRKAKFEKNNITLVTFNDIIKETDAMKEQMETDLKDYWEWVAELLVQCDLNKSKSQ